MIKFQPCGFQNDVAQTQVTGSVQDVNNWFIAACCIGTHMCMYMQVVYIHCFKYIATGNSSIMFVMIGTTMYIQSHTHVCIYIYIDIYMYV